MSKKKSTNQSNTPMKTTYLSNTMQRAFFMPATNTGDGRVEAPLVINPGQVILIDKATLDYYRQHNPIIAALLDGNFLRVSSQPIVLHPQSLMNPNAKTAPLQLKKSQAVQTLENKSLTAQGQTPPEHSDDLQTPPEYNGGDDDAPAGTQGGTD